MLLVIKGILFIRFIYVMFGVLIYHLIIYVIISYLIIFSYLIIHYLISNISLDLIFIINQYHLSLSTITTITTNYHPFLCLIILFN